MFLAVLLDRENTCIVMCGSKCKSDLWMTVTAVKHLLRESSFKFIQWKYDPLENSSHCRTFGLCMHFCIFHKEHIFPYPFPFLKKAMLAVDKTFNICLGRKIKQQPKIHKTCIKISYVVDLPLSYYIAFFLLPCCKRSYREN